MKTTIDTYPIFDANQVLTNDHLNAVVDYLEEQERLTRANLIGIGISCGLALTVDGAAGKVSITRGCAVTSQGFLIVEPADVVLTGYREYELPEGDAYEPFMDGDEQLSMWELFPDGEPDVTKLGSPASFLTGKAVLLFVERDEEDLSDCSPSNCDDKGAEMTLSVRRLLVNASDLAKITGTHDVEKSAAARHALPVLRLNRWDTPATSPTTTRQVLEAFQALVKKDGTGTRLLKALHSAWSAYKSVLVPAWASDPFSSFDARYGFLESVPADGKQVTFLPYYTDLFGDLIAAYEEFRRKGLQLTCQCCPPDDWFPRHVVLGPSSRTAWYPAGAAGCGCDALRAELLVLFRRLVAMVTRFTNEPTLAPAGKQKGVDGQIKVTPSRAGAVALSDKSIPYYYAFTGTPKLHELWNPALSAAGRANQNLAYRSFEYSPAPPSFVSSPLGADLEPFEFFRIEGHLGKDGTKALASLLATRNSWRLPFDVLLLRTGEPDDSVDVDPAAHACRFQDLEADYDELRAQLQCLAKKVFIELGQKKTADVSKVGMLMDIGASKLAATSIKPVTTESISTAASKTSASASGWSSVMGVAMVDAMQAFGFADDSVGAMALAKMQTFGDEAAISPEASGAVTQSIYVLSKLSQLTAALAADLVDVDWDEFDAILAKLELLSEAIAEKAASGDESFQELDDQVANIIYGCILEALAAIRDEYERRVEELRRLSFLGPWAKEHPDFQHRAGVPVGGTFVLVCHGSSKSSGKVADVYDEAIADLADGVVIADFCLPYRCCSDCAPIQFVIGAEPPAPTEPVAIATSAGCTDAKTGANVTITVSGGTAPYTLLVGDKDQGSMPGSLVLQLVTGTYALQATDSKGATASGSVTVNPALAAGAITYSEQLTAGTWTATFPVSGGTQTYTVVPGSVSGPVGATLVSVGPFKSGESKTIVVTDGAKCTLSVPVQHSNPQPCTKPCAGKALRGRYPAWAPVPSKAGPYQYRSVKSWTLKLVDDKNQTLLDQNYTKLVQEVLQTQPTVTVDGYASLMTAVCAALTAKIEAELSPKLEAKAFVLEYDTTANTLIVEWYACHSFTMDVEFTLEGKLDQYTDHQAYSAKGVTVARISTTGETKANWFLPMFGAIDLDKCAGSVGKDCAIDVQNIGSKFSGEELMLKATVAAGTDTTSFTFQWRVELPAVVVAQGQTVTVPAVGAKLARVQLLVTQSKTNCWSFTEKLITITNG